MSARANSSSSSAGKRARFAALALVAILTLLWFLRSPAERAAHASSESDAPSAKRVALALEPESGVRTQLEPSTPPDSTLAVAPSVATAAADMDEKAWITLHVVDSSSAPVAGAVVTNLWTFCSRDGGGESRTATVEATPEKSAADGRMRLAYPVRHARDCAVDALAIAVHHPDFAPFEANTVPLGSEFEVVLVRGEVLVLSGWIGSPDKVINDFDAQFSSEVELQESDWLPRRDGRRTTTRVPRGKHLVQLRHWSPEGVWWSALSEFEIQPGVATEVHLEMFAAVRLRGRLGDEVPRPVTDGRVAVVFARPNPAQEESSGFYSRTMGVIAVDGSFEVPFLSPEPAQIIAICRGWVSRRETATEVRTSAGSSESEAEELRYPSIDLRHATDEVVVAMEPTATLELHALDPQGAPLSAVNVDIYPSVCWDGVGCAGITSDFAWHATTDAAGFARIESVPPGQQWIQCAHERFRLSPSAGEGTSRIRSVDFASGEISRQAFQFELTPGN